MQIMSLYLPPRFYFLLYGITTESIFFSSLNAFLFLPSCICVVRISIHTCPQRDGNQALITKPNKKVYKGKPCCEVLKETHHQKFQ